MADGEESEFEEDEGSDAGSAFEEDETPSKIRDIITDVRHALKDVRETIFSEPLEKAGEELEDFFFKIDHDIEQFLDRDADMLKLDRPILTARTGAEPTKEEISAFLERNSYITKDELNKFISGKSKEDVKKFTDKYDEKHIGIARKYLGYLKEEIRDRIDISLGEDSILQRLTNFVGAAGGMITSFHPRWEETTETTTEKTRNFSIRSSKLAEEKFIDAKDALLASIGTSNRDKLKNRTTQAERMAIGELGKKAFEASSGELDEANLLKYRAKAGAIKSLADHKKDPNSKLSRDFVNTLKSTKQTIEKFKEDVAKKKEELEERRKEKAKLGKERLAEQREAAESRRKEKEEQKRRSSSI